MAGQSRDTATYQTDFLTNRGVGETFEAYSAIVREDATVTRCRYALLMMVFVVNVSISLGVLFYVVRSQAPSPPTPRCWRPASKNMSDSDWLVCRHCSEPVNEQCPEVVDQDFCHLASKAKRSNVAFVCVTFLAGRAEMGHVLYITGIGMYGVAFFETDWSSNAVDWLVDRAGWYVVYSTVRWQTCASPWSHSIYANGDLIAKNSFSNSRGCRNTSHLLVTSFFDNSVRAIASANTYRTQIKMKLQRLS